MARDPGRRSAKHGFDGDTSHDQHLRHPGDKMSDTHLGNAVRHVADQQHSVDHKVMQHKVQGGFNGETNVPEAHSTKDSPGV